MTAHAQPLTLVSVDDYLETETHCQQRHEYLAGQVVAMTGASRAHTLIAGSLHALLLPAARRKGCQLFMADMKVRIDHEGESWFYYPDLVLTCQPDDRAPLFVERPCLIVEVLSPSTEQTDTREKLLAYRLLPSLREYLILRQDTMQADLYQREEGSRWQHLRCSEPDTQVPLHTLDVQPGMGDIYLDVENQ